MSAPAVRFRLDVRISGGMVVLGVHGHVDAATSAELAACATAAVESSTDDVCFDLRQVTFMDCAGIQGLVSTRHALAARGRTLYVDHPPDCVRRLLELSGLEQHFALSLPLHAAPVGATPAPSPDETSTPPGGSDRWARCLHRARRSRRSPRSPQRAPTAATSSQQRRTARNENQSSEPSTGGAGTGRGDTAPAAPMSRSLSDQHGDTASFTPSADPGGAVD